MEKIATIVNRFVTPHLWSNRQRGIDGDIVTWKCFDVFFVVTLNKLLINSQVAIDLGRHDAHVVWL